MRETVIDFCRNAGGPTLTLFLAATTAALGQTSTEPLVVLGAGNIGPWVTEFVLANGSADSIFAAISVSAEPETVCPGDCVNTRFVTITPNGTVTALAPPAGFPLLYFSAKSGPVPQARARIYNSGLPAQSADLPVFRLPTLLALDPDMLVFGIRPQAEHSNLLLTNLQKADQTGGSDVTLRIVFLSTGGQALGTRNLTLSVGQTVYIVNIGQYLGIANPADGQVRVTRVAGTGVFWGILPSLNVDGTISIGLGAVP